MVQATYYSRMTTCSTPKKTPSSSVVGENETVHLFVRDLTVLDYAYFDAEQGPLGGSLDVDVTFIGDLDDEGVVFDFSRAKKAVKQVIDELCDHRFVVPQKFTKTLKHGRLEFAAQYGQNKSLQYCCPAEGLCVLPIEKVSTADIKAYLEVEVLKMMPPNVDAVELTFREENLGEAPSYRYTHGLKQHYGNCQRLIHGHRNRVDVRVEGEVAGDMEKRIGEFWKNIHLAFPENITSAGFIVGQRQTQLKTISLEYVSSQGRFDITLPGSEVYVMPFETTVENIARHLRDCVQGWVGAAKHVQVFAYEGIRKGAHSSSKA
jgi:6-pyruvoyl-tetrahydropterin synthase